MSKQDKDKGQEPQEPKKETEKKAPEPQDNKTEEPKKETQEEESKTNSPKEDVVPKQHYDSIKGELSQKSKEFNEMQKRMERLENRDLVKEMLIDSNYPEPIKAKLRDKLDNLTPDTFESSAEELVDIYNAGLEQKKSEQTLKRPAKAETDDVVDQIKNAKSFDDLLKVEGLEVSN